MKIKKSLWVAAFVAVSALAATPMVQSTTHAAKVSGKVKMKVNGKGYGSFPRATAGTATSSPAIFNVVSTSRPSRKGIRTFTFSVNVDLATATLPVTLPAFVATYTEGGLTGVSETWGGEGITVTIEKIKKGKIVSGKFSGSLPAGATGSGGGPAVIENGTFKVKMLLPIGG